MVQRLPHESASIDITAPPERVYDLVSDVTRMGEWSTECRRCSWTRGATGPEVGARFIARNKGRHGPSWFTMPVVTTAQPAREFAFNRSGPEIGSYTWRYLMKPLPTGTRLTESYHAERPLPAAMAWLTQKWVGGSDRDDDLRQGMHTTLKRMKDAAERS
jgi:uncharacterized protein YndB with AHSA1/START domain